MLGFPTFIALHSVGMAVVVGLSLMVALQLNQIFAGLKGQATLGLLTIAAWGFVLNLITGLALFITLGSGYISSLTFVIKMLLVIIGATILFWLRRRLKTLNLRSEILAGDVIARRMSLVSTASFFGAVVAGRLIAYLSDLYS